MPIWKRLLVLAAICLAPVVVVVKVRYSEGPWLIPAGVLPLFLLGEHWPSPWSLLTVGAYSIVVILLWRTIRRSTPQDGWRSVRGLALLSLAGPAILAASLVPLMRAVPPGVILAISWSGSAAVAWGVLLLCLTFGVASGPPLFVWLLRFWIAFTVLIGVWGFLFGSLAPSAARARWNLFLGTLAFVLVGQAVRFPAFTSSFAQSHNRPW